MAVSVLSQFFVVTPAGRGRGNKPKASDEDDQTAAEKRASMSWAMRLKRVFNMPQGTLS